MMAAHFLLDHPALAAVAERVTIPTQTTLFQEGQQAEYAYTLISGTCLLSQKMIPSGTAKANDLLDELAILGDIPHTQRAITSTECTFLRWRLAELRQQEAFNEAARQILAHRLQQSETRLNELQAPIHHIEPGAQLEPGPFSFPNSTIIFTFCDAKLELDLPQGVSRTGNTMLIAFADFPHSHYANQPDWRFGYRETTFFVPVRVGRILGLYVPYIYSGAYEPILLGREIYGFPKQLGETAITQTSASLMVRHEAYLTLAWEDAQTSSESRIVGAMGRSFGAPGTLTSAAFSVGDVLTQAINLPIYRHINVFNHKRIAGTTTRESQRTYDVEQLTQAVFSIPHWHSIERLQQAALQIQSPSLYGWDLRLRDAYRTRLDVRLSTGRTVRNYKADS
ncbi:MAG: acetoacetate decarboxylase family protein [Anaerolineae bacterium]|nr:acetoacetate decarboxylase family protein [Anaerolineae bacterium]